MSRHSHHITMDELPELRTDADVDALMSRLRARVAPLPPPAAEPVDGRAVSDDAVRDLVAAQDAFASAVVRAMHIMAETLEEFEADAENTASPAAPPVGRRRRGIAQMPLMSRKRARRKAR